MKPDQAKRWIGIVHRVKQTAEGKARPTMIAICQGSKKPIIHELKTEDDEMDFLLGRFPMKFRDTTEHDGLSEFKFHHIKWRDLKTERKPRDYPKNLLRKSGKTYLVATKVPAEFDGLCQGDVVVMIMGGSGDRLAHAISRHGEDIGAKIFRITPTKFKDKRPGRTKDNDHLLLTQLIADEPELFEAVTPRDRDLIRVRELLQDHKDVMKARIAREQRLRSRAIGIRFLSEEGKYPEGAIEEKFDQLRANNVILQSLIEEENQCLRQLQKLIRSLDVWTELFKPIKGCGELLAARIIAGIGDVRRFPEKAKLKAYCGAHVLPDGRLPRKRTGEVANWVSETRQALWLLVSDQFNRHPDSHWGKELIRWKEDMRQKHPEMLCSKCDCVWDDCEHQKESGHTRKYSDGHIHRMGVWRTLTKFVEQVLWRDWRNLLAEAETVEADEKSEGGAAA